MTEPRLSLAFTEQCRMLAAARERGVLPPPAITQRPLVDWEPVGCGPGSMTRYLDAATEKAWEKALLAERDELERDMAIDAMLRLKISWPYTWEIL